MKHTLCLGSLVDRLGDLRIEVRSFLEDMVESELTYFGSHGCLCELRNWHIRHP